MYDLKEGEKAIRTLKTDLTRAEITAKGQELAAQLGDKDRVELEKKTDAEAHKERLKEIDAVCSELAAEIRDKAEWRDVEVVMARDGDVMIVTRLDTGEVVQERPLQQDEKQVTMFPVEAEAQAGDETTG